MRTLEDVLDEVRPAPDPEFVADMERRMRMGFPPRAKRRLPRIVLPSPRPRPLIAAAASAVLALMVTVALTQESGDRGSTDGALAERQVEAFGTDGAGRAAEPLTAPSDSATAVPLPRPIPPPNVDLAPNARERLVERAAQLTLAADPDEFDRLADAVFRIADNRRGFVVHSSFTQGEDAFTGGFFELRVPVGQLQPTLNELSRLATVRARSESGTDVTGTFVSVRDRLRTTLALRTSLLRRLELAATDNAVRALQRRLEIVGNRISGLRAELRGVRTRTEFATVAVELVDRDAGTTAGETDEAFDDAVGSLEDMLHFLIRALGVLLPAALVGLVAWLVARQARRRARERSLA